MLNKELLLMKVAESSCVRIGVGYFTETTSPLTISAISPIGEELGIMIPDDDTKEFILPQNTTLYFRAPIADELIYTGSSANVEISVPIQHSPNEVSFSIVNVLSNAFPFINFEAY